MDCKKRTGLIQGLSGGRKAYIFLEQHERILLYHPRQCNTYSPQRGNMRCNAKCHAK